MVVGERSEIEIDELLWDYGQDGNVAHIARHGVSPRDIYEVLGWGPLTYRDIGESPGVYSVVERNARNHSLIVYLVETETPRVWYPITAYRSRLAHDLLEKEGLV